MGELWGRGNVGKGLWEEWAWEWYSSGEVGSKMGRRSDSGVAREGESEIGRRKRGKGNLKK